MQKIFSFFDDNEFPYFSLEADGNTVAKNSGKTAVNDFEAAKKMLERALGYINPGARVTISCYPSAENYSGKLVFTTYNTETGEAPITIKHSTSSAVAPATFSGSSAFEAFMLGMKMGREEGQRDEKLASMERMLQESLSAGQGSRFDLQGIAENLASTEQGQAILAKILDKLGILD